MPSNLEERIRDLQEAVRRLKPDLLNTLVLQAVHEVLDADDDEPEQDDPEEDTAADGAGEG